MYRRKTTFSQNASPFRTQTLRRRDIFLLDFCTRDNLTQKGTKVFFLKKGYILDMQTKTRYYVKPNLFQKVNAQVSNTGAPVFASPFLASGRFTGFLLAFVPAFASIGINL